MEHGKLASLAIFARAVELHDRIGAILQLFGKPLDSIGQFIELFRMFDDLIERRMFSLFILFIALGQFINGRLPTLLHVGGRLLDLGVVGAKDNRRRAVLVGVRHLARERGVNRIVIAKQAVRIRSLRLMAEHDHRFVLHVDPGEVVVLFVLRCYSISGEDQRGVDFGRPAQRQRREIRAQFERYLPRLFARAIRPGQSSRFDYALRGRVSTRS